MGTSGKKREVRITHGYWGKMRTKYPYENPEVLHTLLFSPHSLDKEKRVRDRRSSSNHDERIPRPFTVAASESILSLTQSRLGKWERQGVTGRQSKATRCLLVLC
jgi:hypothetical protein